MRIHKPTIVVFAKEPRLGFVKTRLARDMGAMRALSFYRSQLGRTVRRLVDPRWRLMVAVETRVVVVMRAVEALLPWQKSSPRA